MEYTTEDVRFVLQERRLPADMAKAVSDILNDRSLSDSEAEDQFNHLEAKCYRFEPNHTRYNTDRVRFPRV